jgi:hypothetical protein
MVRVKFNLFERIKDILLTPRSEWPVIEREFTEPAFLFVRYVALLALIPALAGFIGQSLVGVEVSVGTFREPLLTGLTNAAISYLLSFLIVYVVAIAIDLLAQSFGGERNFMHALKLSVYAHTPVWLAGIFPCLRAHCCSGADQGIRRRPAAQFLSRGISDQGASSTCRQAAGRSAMVSGGFGFGGMSGGRGLRMLSWNQ